MAMPQKIRPMMVRTLIEANQNSAGKENRRERGQRRGRDGARAGRQAGRTFAIATAAEQVDDDDDDERDRDPGSVVDRARPVLDENGDGGELDGQDDEPVVGVVEREGEGPRGVDEAVGEGDVASLDRQVRAHLAEADHDGEADGAHDRV